MGGFGGAVDSVVAAIAVSGLGRWIEVGSRSILILVLSFSSRPKTSWKDGT